MKPRAAITCQDPAVDADPLMVTVNLDAVAKIIGKRYRPGRLILMLALASVPAALGPTALAQQPPPASSQPNFLLIVADDLGYTDIGAYGGEIRTPRLDELAEQSVRFTNFHVLPTCAPTRSMLLSGTDHHVAGVGSMFGANFLVGVDGQVGYEGYLHERVAALPERLADAGYHTYMAGKWHLGPERGRWPGDRGFERAFALLPGSGNHLAIAEQQYVEGNDWVENTPPDFFSTRTYTDKLIEYIDEHRDDGRPFFAYAAYTAPHWPLQAPPDFIDRYAGAYDDGYDVLLEARVARARELGVVPTTDGPGEFERFGAAWDDLSEGEKRHYARRMEIYAAMVENLDYNVGRLIDHVEQIGELDNTVILFMSDNGAEGDEMELNPTFAARIRRENSNNSLANLGAVDSYISYGPGWAQAATAPFSRFKGFANEGGTKVPAFILRGGGTNPVGLDGQYLGAIDIAPTLLDLAGATPAGSSFRGREVARIAGRSFARILGGDDAPVYAADHAFAMELHGARSVRREHYKLVWEQPAGNSWWGYPIPSTWYRWQLYDLQADPGESTDISAEHPELMHELIGIWDDYANTYGVVRDVRIRDFERWQTLPDDYVAR